MMHAHIFADHAGEYAEAGLPVFPVRTRDKRPAIKGWQKATPRLAQVWARKEALACADGVGLLMGGRSGITEIDVDAVGEAWVAAALERFGETPIVIRTASGKAKLWYRHNGEGRHIRPFPDLPIDVLGNGFTVAPPSWREDLGAAYAFCRGSLSDVAQLPLIAPNAFGDGFERAAEGVLRGERNQQLWWWCMVEARHCDDMEALIDVAATWAGAFPDPLSGLEIERCARSAWKYESTGRNFVGLRKPKISEADMIMDALLDEPDAFLMLQFFQRWHGNRAAFAIAPRAMSETRSLPWSRQRIARARDVLLAHGFITELVEPSKKRRQAGQYRLTDRLPGLGHNHNTPFPLH